MADVVATKFNQLHEDLPHGVHNLSSDQLTFALCSAANAPVVTDSVLADLTEISYTNLSSRDATTSTSEGSDGSYELILDDLVLIASDTVPDFRYVVLYNSDSASDSLITFYDNGSSQSLAAGERFVISFATTTLTM